MSHEKALGMPALPSSVCLPFLFHFSGHLCSPTCPTPIFSSYLPAGRIFSLLILPAHPCAVLALLTALSKIQYQRVFFPFPLLQKAFLKHVCILKSSDQICCTKLSLNSLWVFLAFLAFYEYDFS